MIPWWSLLSITFVVSLVSFAVGYSLSRSRTYRRELEAWERGWNAAANKKDKQPGHG